MSCLDLGCGSGDVAFELARLVGANGEVTGIDMDELKVELALKSARERGIRNVTLRVMNVNDWGEERAYDLVYSRFLLQHLRRPVDLLTRMWAAVRAGGALVVEDADFDGVFAEPPNEGLSFFKRLYSAVLERNGGDPAEGRRLYGHVLAAGIPNPSVRHVQSVYAAGEAKGLVLSTLAASADSIVADGLASRDEVVAAIDQLAAFTADPTTLLAEPRVFQVWAYRSE
jgi:ubiquinone/menaquinone biosynthesis C-methylase UbiE